MPREQTHSAGEVELSDTASAVLGLLTFGPRSGYDLLKLAESSIGFFWTPARSHVYSALRRLAALGLVSEERVEQHDRPSKRVYSLTEQGEAALREWVQAADADPDYIRSQLLLKVFFGGLASRETVAALVTRRREDAQRTASRLREIEQQIGGSEEWFYPYLTLKYGLARTEAVVRWADEVLLLLDVEGEPA
jgi:PadR family transcriptional regulator AphA